MKISYRTLRRSLAGLDRESRTIRRAERIYRLHERSLRWPLGFFLHAPNAQMLWTHYARAYVSGGAASLQEPVTTAEMLRSTMAYLRARSAGELLQLGTFALIAAAYVAVQTATDAQPVRHVHVVALAFVLRDGA